MGNIYIFTLFKKNNIDSIANFSCRVGVHVVKVPRGLLKLFESTLPSTEVM